MPERTVDLAPVLSFLSAHERLVAAAAEPKRYVVVPGVGHNDPELLDGRVMLDAIRRFLTETAVLGQ